MAGLRLGNPGAQRARDGLAGAGAAGRRRKRKVVAALDGIGAADSPALVGFG